MTVLKLLTCPIKECGGEPEIIVHPAGLYGVRCRRCFYQGDYSARNLNVLINQWQGAHRRYVPALHPDIPDDQWEAMLATLPNVRLETTE